MTDDAALHVSVTEVRAGPAGLVVVTLRLDSGARVRIVLPPKLAGVAEVEWSAQAVATLAELQRLRP